MINKLKKKKNSILSINILNKLSKNSILPIKPSVGLGRLTKLTFA